MVCRFFSDLKSAKERIHDYCLLKEQDVFIVRTVYPSGEEYSFRLRDEITFIDSARIVSAFFIPLDWKFKKKENAITQAEIMADKTGRIFTVKEHTRYNKGYREIMYYTITDKLGDHV